MRSARTSESRSGTDVIGGGVVGQDSSYSQFTGHNADEWIYEDRAETSPAQRSRSQPNQLVVSRRLVNLQGVLLGAVALSSFTLGVMVGRRNRRANEPHEVVVRLTGSVRFRSRSGFELPDEGAVVMAFGRDQSLDAAERLAVEGLRPSDPLPKDNHESLRKIRELAGGYARADRSGDFLLKLPSTGQYYFLCLSHHAERGPNEQLDKQRIAQMGRYFGSVVELVGAYRYQWRELTLQRDQSIEVKFEPGSP